MPPKLIFMLAGGRRPSHRIRYLFFKQLQHKFSAAFFSRRPVEKTKEKMYCVYYTMLIIYMYIYIYIEKTPVGKEVLATGNGLIHNALFSCFFVERAVNGVIFSKHVFFCGHAP